MGLGVGVAATRLLAALLTVAAIASAQEASLEVRQVDASGFPTVKLFVSITDANGNPLTDLSPADFKVDESGKEVASPQIPAGGEPVCAFLVIDRSGSMSEGDKMGQAREAASRFVEMMRPGDRTGVIAFDSVVEVLSQPTESKEALKATIRTLRPNGETACFSAVRMALETLSAEKGRRSVIVMTDGKDNQSDMRGDTISMVSGRATELGVPVFAIGLGEDVQEDLLRRLGRGSHGNYAFAPTGAELVGLFARQAEQIQKEFVVTYESPNRNPDAKRREVTVRATWHGRELSGTAAYAPSGTMPGQAPEARSPGSVWGVFLMIAIILGFLGAAPILLKRAQDGAKEAAVPGGAPQGKPIPAAPPPTADAAKGRVRVIAPTQAPPLPAGPARVKIIAGTEPPPAPPTDALAAPPVAPPAAPRVRILPPSDAPPPAPPADAPPPPPPPDPPPTANP